MTTDPAVLTQAERRYGDSASFDEFFASQRVPAVRFAYLLCGDATAAEEIAAEALAKICAVWRRRDISDPVAYLRRSLVNEVRSRVRRRVLERRQLSRRADQVQEPLLADRAVDHQALVAALLSLPLHQRAPIVLRFFEDLSEHETAEVLGKDIGTIKSSVSRGLARLRQTLDTKEWNE